MTSSSVGWVVLDGSGIGPATLDHDVFDVAPNSADDGDISRHIGAVRSAQAIAAASGQVLASIGVTWTDDAAAAAYLVRNALPGLGFDKVVPVRLAGADDDELTLARGAALAVRSGVEAVAVPLPHKLSAAEAQPRKQSGSPARAAAVLVGGFIAVFVAAPALAGQPEPQPPESQPASDPSAISMSVHAVPLVVAPPVADAVQFVVRRPAPVPRQPSAPVAAEPVTVPRAWVPQAPAPVVALSTEVAHLPAEIAAQPAFAPPLPGPAPIPAAPVPDPAQVVFSPLFGAVP